MDFNKIRNEIKAMNQNCDFDSAENFYYDETNNLRKFYLNQNSFNAPHEGNFVLGGIVGNLSTDEIDALFATLKFQPNINEVKFSHVASGAFVQVLKSTKLNSIFEFLLLKNVCIHYFTVNFLYYSLVDIIDSAIVGSKRNDLIPHHVALKSVIYDICKAELASVVDIFKHFKYPNIKDDEAEKFVYHFRKILTRNRKMFPEAVPEIIEILEESAKRKSLPFITDEEDGMLIKRFYPFYMQPIQVFSNSTHLIDNEVEVIEDFEKMEKTGIRLINKKYSFADSKSSRHLQISDVVVGFIGKLTHFINTNNPNQIAQAIKLLGAKEKITLTNFFDVYNASITRNPGYINSIMPILDHRMLAQIEALAKAA